MLELVQVPVWRDNYVYLVLNGRRAFVVDPPEAGPVLDHLGALEGVQLEAVLNTHHHPDHVGGNRALVDATGCAVVGPAHDQARIPAVTRTVSIGEAIEIAGLRMVVLDVRAHTRGHIAYRTDASFDRVTRHGHGGEATEVPRLGGRIGLFVGDSLFLGGCGRLFEGTATDLHASMQVLRGQPEEALVCCAHEYTASNLRFATHAMPGNGAIRARLDGLEAERGASRSSVPDVLGREFETNPFLLALDAENHDAIDPSIDVPVGDIAGVLGALRSAKDTF